MHILDSVRSRLKVKLHNTFQTDSDGRYIGTYDAGCRDYRRRRTFRNEGLIKVQSERFEVYRGYRGRCILVRGT
jgi:hypothetical protein